MSDHMEEEVKIESKLAFQTLTSIVLVTFDEVLCFEYLPRRQRWSLRLTNNECYKLKNKTTAKTLLSKHLDFVQISQGCIVNLKYLQSVENVTLKCKLYSPFTEILLVMSQRYYANLKNRLEML